MPTTIRSLIDAICSIASSTRDQGGRFEQLMRQYFLNDPLYLDQFSDVWLWIDWPQRGNEPDTGIDLVAKNREGDGYTAIQCKCFSEEDTIQRGDIDCMIF